MTNEDTPKKDNPIRLGELIKKLEGRSKRAHSRIYIFALSLFFGPLVVMILFGVLGFFERSGILCFAGVVALVLVIVWKFISARNLERRQIIELIGYRDIRTLGTLLECTDVAGKTKYAVFVALRDLLPHADDSVALNTTQREALNMLLYQDSRELALAAMQALNRIGDASALPYLTSIAAGKGIPGSLRKEKALAQDMATECVRLIQERVEQQNRPSVLLRASSAPVTPGDQLVRPAINQNDVNSHELVRSQPEDVAAD